MESCHSI